MSKKPKTPLPARVEKAAAEALAARDYVSPIDVLVGLGWLQPEAVERWRRGQVDYLERVVETNLHRISEAMHLFRSWAVKQRLNPSETGYVTRKPRRETLRFSKSGDATIERLYRTHSGLPRAVREEATASGGKGRSRARIVGHPAIEQGLDVPQMRRDRRLSDDGRTRPGLSGLRGPWRSGDAAGGQRFAHAPGQSEKRAQCRRRSLQQVSRPV